MLLLLSASVLSYGQQSDQAPDTEANARNLVVMANRFYELKAYDRAIQAATNAVPLLPKDHRPWAIIGNCYLAQWKMKSASEAYAKAGMAEMSVKFKAMGSEVYVEAQAVKESNRAL